MRTLHLGLRVSDLELSLAFYAALGYEVLGEVPETAFGSLTMLKLPGDPFVSLELVHDPARDAVEPGSLNHLVVQTDDLAGLVERLAGQGVTAEEPTSPDGSDGFWTAWLTDPDGHRIELVQWPAGHPEGMGVWDFGEQAPSPRPAREVVEEYARRLGDGDETVLDDLVAPDLVNHAAGPQGREGLRQILRSIEADLGPTRLELHHLVAEGNLVVQHVTLHGTHRGSSMPLLADVPATGRPAQWRFIHIWRVADGLVVEHWACRDDHGLVDRLRRG